MTVANFVLQLKDKTHTHIQKNKNFLPKFGLFKKFIGIQIISNIGWNYKVSSPSVVLLHLKSHPHPIDIDMQTITDADDIS